MKKVFIILCFLLLFVFSLIMIPKVDINYNLADYLPKDSEITKSLEIYKENFGEASFSYISFDETNFTEVILIKEQIKALSGVKTVLFVDDYLNELTYSIIRNQTPEEQQPILDSLLTSELMAGKTYAEALFAISVYFPVDVKMEIQGLYNAYVSDEEVLVQVIFTEGTTSSLTEEGLDSIRLLLEEKAYTYHIKGDAASAQFTKDTITKETLIITIIIIPIILAILILMSKSVFDLILFAIIAGVAIVINLGTNALLPNISYITQSMAIALQLAISLDYIIFMLSSYHFERSLGHDVDKALEQALKKTRRPVIASALTTGVSFLALLVMKFTIGFDIGIVFAKAIFISLLTTIFLLPILIKVFSKYIDRTRKSTKFLNFGIFSKFAAKATKYRYFFLAFLILIITPVIYFQSQNEFTYGVSGFSATEGTVYYEDSIHIDETFGRNNTYLVLVEKNDALETELYQKLMAKANINRVNAGIYYKMMIDDPLIVAYITQELYSDNYALFEIITNSEVESTASFEEYENLVVLVDEIGFEEVHIIGETAVSYNLKEIVLRDFTWVLIIAVIAVVLIIFISFKNFLIPIILTTVIEVAVFMSMSLLNLFDENLVFLAYLIVTTILLGATIDYAILFSKRYMEERLQKDKIISVRNASLQTSPSIITSALLFIVAGLTIAVISSITSISQIGLLIAVGAFISLLFVLVLLPQILLIFDRYIIKSKF